MEFHLQKIDSLPKSIWNLLVRKLLRFFFNLSGHFVSPNWFYLAVYHVIHSILKISSFFDFNAYWMHQISNCPINATWKIVPVGGKNQYICKPSIEVWPKDSKSMHFLLFHHLPLAAQWLLTNIGNFQRLYVPSYVLSILWLQVNWSWLFNLNCRHWKLLQIY